jgi:hypothetical protein
LSSSACSSVLTADHDTAGSSSVAITIDNPYDFQTTSSVDLSINYD